MPQQLCPCGQPLHYPTEEDRARVEALIAELGSEIKVTVEARSWMVPRHYLALHGVIAAELPALAQRYGFKELTEPS